MIFGKKPKKVNFGKKVIFEKKWMLQNTAKYDLFGLFLNTVQFFVNSIGWSWFFVALPTFFGCLVCLESFRQFLQLAVSDWNSLVATIPQWFMIFKSTKKEKFIKFDKKLFQNRFKKSHFTPIQNHFFFHIHIFFQIRIFF